MLAAIARSLSVSNVFLLLMANPLSSRITGQGTIVSLKPRSSTIRLMTAIC